MLTLTAILGAIVSAPVKAQLVQFFGSFQSYSQSMSENAQGLVANASGGLYISGNSALAYVPVDANGNPLSAGQTDINVGGTLVNSTTPPYSTAQAMGLAIDANNNLFRVDPTESLVQMFIHGSDNINFTYQPLGSGWNKPSSVTVDSNSNVYVLDAGTGSIVELMLNGDASYKQTTLFTNLALVNTTGLSIDSAGNFYVASGPVYGTYSLNASTPPAVYKITNRGSYSLSTIGSGWVSPSATTVDAAGNLWVVDYGAGTINLLAATGGGSLGDPTVYQSISGIRTLMINRAGRIFGFAYVDGGLADAAIWIGGSPPHNLGSYNVGTAAPTATVTVDFMSPATAGAFNVTTQGASTVEFQATGSTCVNGTTYATSMTCTAQITFTPMAAGMRTGALVVTDGSGNVLGTNYFYGVGLAPSLAYTPGKFSTRIPNTYGLVQSSGVALDEAGNLYVTDQGTYSLSKFAAGSSTATVLNNNSQVSMGITVDGAGNLWLAQCWANDILLKTLISPGIYADSVPFSSGLNCPYDVAVDGSGNVYIAEPVAGVVLKETLNNGSYAKSTVVSGLSDPRSVAVDSSGNVYVTDTGNNRVLEETPSGSSYTQTLVANTGLSSPEGLAVDPNGNVYISDSGNGRIVKATPTGATFIQSTLLTTGMIAPVGLALDAAGNLYIDDQSGHVIEELNVSSAPSFAFAPAFAGSASLDNPKSTALFNYGNATLNISTISIPAGFSSGVATTCALSSETLEANTTCILGMDFMPILGVPYIGNVILADNNLNVPASTQTISLSGTGLPNVILSPASETLPAGIVGVAYSQKFAPDGGSSPYTYAVTITNGNLPTGLSFSGGVLSGTPSATSTVTFSIVATDNSASPGPYSSSSQSYSLTIEAAVVLGISPGSLNDGAAGIRFSQTITAIGGSTSYSYAVTSGSLPAWLSLNALSGVLSGTPTVAGPIAFTITATDMIANVTASQAYSATIYAAASAAPTQSAGSSNIGTPASTTPLNFTFNIPASVASIIVVTQGVANKDFTNSGSGTCTAVAYSATNTCTVDVAFNPLGPGTRYGAVLLKDASGNVLGTGYVSGTGTGPQITFQPGTETTVASGTSPFNLAEPAGIAIDAGGNLYIPDAEKNAVYKETLSGGSYIQSTVATLGFPRAVALDGAGNVYITQGFKSTVYKETPSGGNHYTQSVISSNAGYPMGIAVDGGGNVFVVDGDGSVIYELTLSAGSYSQSTIIRTGLNSPSGIAVDASGNLYIADAGNQQVWKETFAAGSYTATAVGSGLQLPTGVQLDAAGNVYISDYANGQVLKETWSVGAYTQSVVPTGSQIHPWETAMDASGNLFIVDPADNLVLKEDYADQPNLAFADTTNVGNADPGNPLTVRLLNIGNAPLVFPVPATGTNPAIVNGSFTIDSASSCTQISAGGVAGSLAAGASCTYAVDFTPQATGANSGTLTVQDNHLNNASAAQPIALSGTGVSTVITVSPLAETLAAGTVNLAYSQSFTASGGSGPYTFASSGALPAGLWLGASGVLTGTPTIAGGPWSFSVTATDTISGSHVSQSYTLSIEQGTATITLGGLLQTYSGSPLAATATTSPVNLAVSLIYSQEGSPVAAPTTVGSYAVIGTINDKNYRGKGSGTLVIGTAATAVSVAASANPAVRMSSVTLTATVSSAAGTPAGQISFLDGTTPLGSAAVSAGVATFTTAALAAGTHSISATYSASADFNAASSSLLSLTVVDLSLGNPGAGSTGQSQTTTPGGSASYTVALAPSAGTTFPSPITLLVTGLPLGVTATLGTPGWTEQSPTTWILPANQPVRNILLKLQMPAQMAAAEPSDGPARKLPLLAVGLLLVPFARKWRKTGKRMNWWPCLLLIAAVISAVTGVTGCGDPSSPPQTYNVTVTVTAGALTHSTQLALTVN